MRYLNTPRRILLALGAMLPFGLSAQTSGDASLAVQVLPGTGRCSNAGAAARFPEEASRHGINFGAVDLQMTVGEGGVLRDVTIVQSTNSVFNASALEAARQLHCENSTGAEIRLRYSLDFAIEGYEEQARAASRELHASLRPVEQPAPPVARALAVPKPAVPESTPPAIQPALDEQSTDVRTATAARAAKISDAGKDAPITGADFLNLVSRLNHFDVTSPSGQRFRFSLSSGTISIVDLEKIVLATGKYRTENSSSELCIGDLEPAGFAQIAGCYRARHNDAGALVLSSTSRSFRLVVRQSD